MNPVFILNVFLNPTFFSNITLQEILLATYVSHLPLCVSFNFLECLFSQAYAFTKFIFLFILFIYLLIYLLKLKAIT